MKAYRIITFAAIAASLAIAQPSFAADSASGKSSAASAAKPGSSTIVGLVLANDGEFDVLQAAVVRAGLVDALNGNRQYTVFAPTDAAFVKTLEVANEEEAIAAVNSIPVLALKNILLYHVTAGRHTSTSVLAASSYRMLNDGRLTRLGLFTAGIAAVDISASNGVIHAINSVLIP